MSAGRYHFNPKTGAVRACKATKSCPFGEAAHGATEDEARALYEATMEASVLPAPQKDFDPTRLTSKFIRVPGEPTMAYVGDETGRLLGNVSIRDGFYLASVHDGRGPRGLGTFAFEEEAQEALWKNGGQGQEQLHEQFLQTASSAAIDAIERKHFQPGRNGSKFNGGSVKTLLQSALIHRGSLDGDDRQKLIRAGADSDSFLSEDSGVRYLMVPAEGTTYMKDTATMGEDEVLHVRGKLRSDGRPPNLSFSAPMDKGEPTTFATVIIGPDEDEQGNSIPGTETLWTAHPGAPTRGIRTEVVREKGLEDGDSITVGDFRRLFGRDIVANGELAD